MCHQKHKWENINLVQKKKINKKKNSTGKFPPYILQMHPKNILHTQARFTNNTHIYHIHSDRRWNLEKGTTQEGLNLGSYYSERGESF